MATETTGSNNCAFGLECLANQNGVDGSSSFGNFSGQSLTTGTGNSIFGFQSLNGETDGSQNSSFGYNTLTLANNSNGNTAMGFQAGASNVNYTNCTFLGLSADASVPSLTNATAIGANAIVDTDNSLVLGNGANIGIGTSSPASELHLVGIFQQKGITSGWTGTDVYRGQTSIQTTNNSLTTIATFPVGTTNDPALTCTATVVGVKTDGSDAGFTLISTAGAWYNGTTTASIGGLPTILVNSSAGFVTTSVSWGVSGNNLILQVTGIAATNINWVATYQYHRVTTSTS